MHRVVVIGGGFGGLNVAKALKNAPVDVTVIDRRNYHLFQPLLYQVATGALSPGEIATPIRNVLRKNKNTRVLMGDVRDIDANAREVILRDGAHLPYDSLVVATGSTHHYFGHDEWGALAPGLKTIDDATAVRKKILFAFEAAERESDPEKRKAWLTFVIVGGGPTGVELAGALAEIARDTLREDFRGIHTPDAQIILVEGSDRILQTFPKDLSASAEGSLVKMGVRPLAHASVVSIDPDGVVVKFADRQERINTKCVLWAAGVRANRLGKVLAERAGAQIDRAGRVVVGPDCSIQSHPEIFVIGDLASFAQDGKPLPGVAQVAMQAGTYVARAIQRRLRNEPSPPFRYWDKGNLATIGRLSAVADLGGKFRFSGPIAWFIWLFIHLLYLVGYGNRLLVLTEWAFNYFTHNRSARLITGEIPELPGGEAPSTVPGVRGPEPVLAAPPASPVQ